MLYSLSAQLATDSLWNRKYYYNLHYYDYVAEFGERKPPKVGFGSGVERRMFPTHSAPTRMGIEQGIRGQPHVGPGYHSPDPVRLAIISYYSYPNYSVAIGIVIIMTVLHYDQGHFC